METNRAKVKEIKNRKFSNPAIRAEDQHELLLIIAEELTELNHYFSDDRFRKLLGKLKEEQGEDKGS